MTDKPEKTCSTRYTWCVTFDDGEKMILYTQVKDRDRTIKWAEQGFPEKHVVSCKLLPPYKTYYAPP